MLHTGCMKGIPADTTLWQKSQLPLCSLSMIYKAVVEEELKPFTEVKVEILQCRERVN